MNITAQTENRICVELTAEDMLDLDITYEELDYSNIETRRVLWTLLDEARQELGRNICLSQRLLIEAMPDSEGGCAIFFTVADSEFDFPADRRLIKGALQTVVCQTDNIDDFSALSAELLRWDGIKKSELFTDGKSYRLTLQPDLNFKGDIAAVLCEFCVQLTSGAEAYTREHWKRLITPDAIGVLAAAMGK